MMAVRRLYLAGPDVFLVDAAAVGARKVALCASCGFEGLFPLDADIPEREVASGDIYRANMRLLRSSDGVVANLTPFRGISADVGTVYEVAYALALGKPVFGYSEAVASLGPRIRAAFGSGADQAFAGDGMIVEDFGLPDNLMIAEGLATQGWPMAVGGPGTLTPDLFAACLQRAEAYFSSQA